MDALEHSLNHAADAVKTREPTKLEGCTAAGISAWTNKKHIGTHLPYFSGIIWQSLQVMHRQYLGAVYLGLVPGRLGGRR